MLPTRYRDLLAVPDAPLPAAAALAGRLPEGMLGLAILLFLQEQSGSFGPASAVGAALTFGWAVGAIGQARVIDRLGQPRPLAVCGLLHALATLLLVLGGEQGWPTWSLIALGATIGLTVPQLGACMRALWGMLIPVQDGRRLAYAWEAVVGELFFIVGPSLVSLMIVVASAQAALVGGAIVGGAGTLLFAASPAARRWAPDGTPQSGLGVLRSEGVRTLLVVTVASSVALGALDVGIQGAAIEQDARALGGVLITVLSISSVVGGLVWGRRAPGWPPGHRFAVLNTAFAIALVPAGALGGLAALGVLLLVAGLPIASLGVEVSGLIDHVAPEGGATEAYGWTITAVLVGAGGGIALGGALVDTHGASLAMVAAATAAGCAALLAWLRVGTLAIAPEAAR